MKIIDKISESRFVRNLFNKNYFIQTLNIFIFTFLIIFVYSVFLWFFFAPVDFEESIYVASYNALIYSIPLLIPIYVALRVLPKTGKHFLMYVIPISIFIVYFEMSIWGYLVIRSVTAMPGEILEKDFLDILLKGNISYQGLITMLLLITLSTCIYYLHTHKKESEPHVKE